MHALSFLSLLPLSTLCSAFALRAYTDSACQDLQGTYTYTWNGSPNCWSLGTDIYSFEFDSESDDCEAAGDAVFDYFYVSTSCSESDNVGGGCGADGSINECLQTYGGTDDDQNVPAQYVISGENFSEDRKRSMRLGRLTRTGKM